MQHDHALTKLNLDLLTPPPKSIQGFVAIKFDNPYFEQMFGQIYSIDLQLNNANCSDTEAPF